MIVHRPRLRLSATEARVAATVESETGAFPATELFIGVPRVHVGWLDLSGNPFLPSLLLLAATLKERLRLEAPVSQKLLSQAGSANGLYSSWFEVGQVEVEAEPRLPDVSVPAGDGALFFSRGVDSWYSALRARDGQTPVRVTHLLYVPDIDIQYSAATQARALRFTREAAACIGFPLVALSSNIRQFLHPLLDWSYSHGGVLAGLGLALGERFSAIVLASTYTHYELCPWGSHPHLDPLWSTDRTAILQDGENTTRLKKVQAIGRCPDALARLKVCWSEDIDTNCGRCLKCASTHTTLLIAGLLDQTPAFEHRVGPEDIANFPAELPESWWVQYYESIPPTLALKWLRDVARTRLPSWHPDSPAKESLSVRPVVQAAPGLAVELLPDDVRKLLPGPVVVQGAEGGDPAGPGLEITWGLPTAGRVPLPLRPTSARRRQILEMCRGNFNRRVPWCLVEPVSLAGGDLVARLTDSWGPGITYLSRSPIRDDPETFRRQAAAIQQQCQVRAWTGKYDRLDPFRVLESLTQGCLPLQFMAEDSHDRLLALLPDGLGAFTMALPQSGLIPSLAADDLAERLDLGLSVILAGSLERDLAWALTGIPRGAHAA